MDVHQFRELFPVLRENPQLAYLDNATAKLIPDPVLKAFNEPPAAGFMIPRKGTHIHTMKATEILEGARDSVAQWHGKPPSQVIFQPTLPLANLLVAEALRWNHTSSNDSDDRGMSQCFLLFAPDTHNSTLLPWMHAANRWKWRWKVLDANFLNPKLGPEILATFLENIDMEDSLPVLILSDVSMVLGWNPPLTKFQRLVKKHEGKIVLDISRGYQFHVPTQRWKNVDYLVASLGVALWMPHGLAIAIGNEEWPTFSPSFVGSGMVRQVTTTNSEAEKPPLGLEPDTLSLPHLNALTVALQLLKDISPQNIRQHDEKMKIIALDDLLEQPLHCKSYHVLSRMLNIDSFSQGVLSLVPAGIDPTDIAIFLEELYQVIIRSGDQCTQLLFHFLTSNTLNHGRGVIQASFSYYNTEEDVMKLIKGLEEAFNTFSSQ